MISRTTLWSSCALGVCLGAATVASAQGAGRETASQASAKKHVVSSENANQAARESAGSQNIEAGSVPVLSQIVVTATKMPQTAQHTPVALTVITDQLRNLVGILDAADIVNYTPSMSLTGEFLSLRGVGRYTTELGTDPGVAVFVDGIYTDSPDYLNQPDFFTDRIEVLEGPQGTLSGRNAIGGEVNIVEKRPTKEFHTEDRIGYNNYHFLNIDSSVSGTIFGNLEGRLAAAYTDQPSNAGVFLNLGSPIRPGAGTTRLVEGQLSWSPSDSVNLWFKVQNYASQGTPGAGISQTEYPGLVAYAESGLGPNPASTLPPASNPQIYNPFVVDYNTPGKITLSDDWTYTLHATGKLSGGTTVEYIGGYSQYHYGSITDLDGTALTAAPWDNLIAVGPQDHKWYQNEIDVKSSSDQRLRWVAGVFQYWERYYAPYWDEEPDNPTMADPQYPGVNGCTFGNCPLAPPNPTRATYNQTSSLRSTSQAVFGNLDYDLTETFRLTGGLRYNWDQKYGQTSYRYVYDTAGIYLAPGINSLDVTPGEGANAGGPSYGYKSDSWKDWTGKVGAEWHPNASTMAYFSIAKGYKSGGMILGNIIPIPVAPAEKLYAYELGFKKTFGRKFLLATDVFYYDYRNLQQVLLVDNDSTGVNIITSALTNAQRARTYGFELQSTWSPIDSFHLTFNYSYLHARFTEFTNSLFPGQQIFDTSIKPPPGCLISGTSAACPGYPHANLDGDTIPQAPTNKFTLIPVYTMRAPGGTLTLSAPFAWIDQQYYGIFTEPGFLAPHYYNLDLRAFYQFKDHYALVLDCGNCTNQRQVITAGTGSYLTGPANLSSDPATVYPVAGAYGYGINTPRNYGIELQYRY